MEAAKAALRKGFSIEDVVEITGLSRETVLGLKNEWKTERAATPVAGYD